MRQLRRRRVPPPVSWHHSHFIINPERRNQFPVFGQTHTWLRAPPATAWLSQHWFKPLSSSNKWPLLSTDAWCMQPNLISKQTNSNQFTVIMKLKSSPSIISLYFKSDQNQCLFAGYWLWIEESRSDPAHVPPPHTGHWGQCWSGVTWGTWDWLVSVLHGSPSAGYRQNKLALTPSPC